MSSRISKIMGCKIVIVFVALPCASVKFCPARTCPMYIPAKALSSLTEPEIITDCPLKKPD
jgi:hypothetical protein